VKWLLSIKLFTLKTLCKFIYLFTSFKLGILLN
jgi:hypothetical protein